MVYRRKAQMSCFSVGHLEARPLQLADAFIRNDGHRLAGAR